VQLPLSDSLAEGIPRLPAMTSVPGVGCTFLGLSALLCEVHSEKAVSTGKENMEEKVRRRQSLERRLGHQDLEID
jgi:hypothetical protein